MREINILYLHGLGSCGKSHTYSVLKDLFESMTLLNAHVYSIDIPTNPKEAIKKINKFVKLKNINIVVGTSLGGFYTMLVDGVAKIAINPAMHPSELLPTLVEIGKPIEYFGEREDGATTYTLTKVDIEDFRSTEHEFYTNTLDEEYTYETYGVFGADDDVVNDIDEFLSLYRKYRVTRVNGLGHRLTEDCIKREIKNVILDAIDNMSKEFVV